MTKPQAENLLLLSFLVGFSNTDTKNVDPKGTLPQVGETDENFACIRQYRLIGIVLVVQAQGGGRRAGGRLAIPVGQDALQDPGSSLQADSGHPTSYSYRISRAVRENMVNSWQK